MQDFKKQTFKIYWSHLKKYGWLFLLALFGVMIGSGAFVFAPLYYKKFFDILGSGDVPANLVGALISILWQLLSVYLLGWLGWRIALFTGNYLQSRTAANLYNTCFAYLHQHSVSFFNNSFVGSLVKRVNRFPNAFVALSDMLLYEFIPLLVNVGFISIVLWLKNWQLGLGVVVWMIIFVFVNYYFSMYKMKFDLQRNAADTAVTGFLADTISNHQNVKLFSGYAVEVTGFKAVVETWRHLRQFTWDISQIFETFQSLMVILLELGVFYLAIGLWQKNLLTIGDFVLLQAYLINIFHRFWDFGRMIRRYYEHVSDAAEMTEILLEPHQVKDIVIAKPLKVASGEINFTEIIFSYSGTRKIFNKLNLAIKSRQRLALVGPSGAGKSSIVNLLLRNYDLDGGSIKIDGQKISQVTLESLWHSIALVPQDPILFHRSLMENIRYGSHNATDAEVIASAKLAHADEFISNFSAGYNTLVGERGVKLSGGERQRIAIARAILKNAPILILDEATSSLDSESEYLIQQALDVLMKDKTVIVIAHRLSTIMKSDRIIVLDEGKIVEDGSHAELVKQKGLYAGLWHRQVCGFIQ